MNESLVEDSRRSVVAHLLCYNIVASEFDPQLRYYAPFQCNIHGKVMDPLILPTVSLIEPLLFYTSR